MNELKPCPFCGGKNIYVDGYDHAAGKRWRVVCLDCMGMVDPGTIQQKYTAIDAWNHRASDDKDIEIKQLRKENQGLKANSVIQECIIKNGRNPEDKEKIVQLTMELAESQRREKAAVEDMKIIVDAVREEHCDETCCFACKYDGDFSITETGDYANECPGFERDDCFDWRGPADEKGADSK